MAWAAILSKMLLFTEWERAFRPKHIPVEKLVGLTWNFIKMDYYTWLFSIFLWNMRVIDQPGTSQSAVTYMSFRIRHISIITPLAFQSYTPCEPIWCVVKAHYSLAFQPLVFCLLNSPLLSLWTPLVCIVALLAFQLPYSLSPWAHLMCSIITLLAFQLPYRGLFF